MNKPIDYQIFKTSLTLPPDPDFKTQVILRIIISVTITFTAFKKYHQLLFKIMGESFIVNLIWFYRTSMVLGRSLALIIVRKRKKIDFYKENVKYIFNVEHRYRKRKTALRIKKKAMFFLLRKMMKLIHIHTEIKPIVKVMLGAGFGFWRFNGNILFQKWWLDTIGAYHYCNLNIIWNVKNQITKTVETNLLQTLLHCVQKQPSRIFEQKNEFYKNCVLLCSCPALVFCVSTLFFKPLGQKQE